MKIKSIGGNSKQRRKVVRGWKRDGYVVEQVTNINGVVFIGTYKLTKIRKWMVKK